MLSIAITALRSRTIRSAITSTGTRRIATRATTSTSSGDIVTKIVKGFSRFFGGIFAGLSSFFGSLGEINFTNIWSSLVSTYKTIYNFNWNVTDKELDEKIKEANTGIAGALGGALGSALGYAICGGIPTAALAVFNAPLAMHVWKELGEEALDEVGEKVAELVRLSCQQLMRMGFTHIYKSMRSILRPAALGVANFLVSKGILSKESVDAANKKKGEPWSFAKALEDTVEDVKDPLKQNFLEEFYEELGDACVDAGYVVAGALDSFFAQQRLANNMLLGTERTIEIEFGEEKTKVKEVSSSSSDELPSIPSL